MSSFNWWKNHWGRWNIFRFKGGKRKTTKDISRRLGYTKTCSWDLRRMLVKDYAVYKKWINERIQRQKIL